MAARRSRRAGDFRHVIHDLTGPGDQLPHDPACRAVGASIPLSNCDALDAELRAVCADSDAGLDAALSELHAAPDVARRRALHTP